MKPFICLISLIFSFPSFAADPSFKTETDKKFWQSTLKCLKDDSVMLWKDSKSSFIRIDPEFLKDFKKAPGIRFFVRSAQKNEESWHIFADGSGEQNNILEMQISSQVILIFQSKTIQGLACEVGEPVEQAIKIKTEK